MYYLILFFISMIVIAFIIDYFFHRRFNKNLREMSSTREGLRAISQKINDLSKELARQQAQLESLNLDELSMDFRLIASPTQLTVKRNFLIAYYKESQNDLIINHNTATKNYDYASRYCQPKSKVKDVPFGRNYPRLASCS